MSTKASKISCTVKAKALKAALQMVAKAVSANMTLPIMSTIRLAFGLEGLDISGTDLEWGVRMRIPCEAEATGEVCIPGKILVDTIGSIPDDLVITLAVKDELDCIVQATGFKTTLKGVPASDFPPMPEWDHANAEEVFQLPAGQWKLVVNQVAYAACTDVGRPILQNIKIGIEGNVATLCATDGFRIPIRAIAGPLTAKSQQTLLVSARSMTRFVNTLDSAGGMVSMFVETPSNAAVSPKVIMACTGEDTSWLAFFIQAAGNNFPDVKAVIPKSFKFTTPLPREDTLKAVKRAAIFADNNAVTIHPAPTGFEITSCGDTGNASCAVTVPGEGAGIALLGANATFLSQTLNALDGDGVLKSNNDKSAFLIGDGKSYMVVIMPIHTDEVRVAAASAAAASSAASA